MAFAVCQHNSFLTPRHDIYDGPSLEVKLAIVGFSGGKPLEMDFVFTSLQVISIPKDIE